MSPNDGRERTAYVVKVYPRFSETFVVTEILAREAAGENLAIYALRPTTDVRFHPELAAVQAPVTHLPRPHKLSSEWEVYARAQAELPGFAQRFGELMPLLVRFDASDVAQAVDLALRLSRDGITHVHVHFASLAARCAAVACALTDIPFSVTTHAKDLFHRDVDRILLTDVLARARTVIAISEYNEEYLAQLDPTLPEHTVLVRNGLDLNRFPFTQPRTPGEALRVLAVGRLVEKKGFNHLVGAAALAKTRGIPLHIRIVGEGEDRSQLSELIHQTDTTDVVSLVGARSQAELRDELGWADVLVAPCVVGADGNADGLPTVLLEAMASGVPCIATDVTGIPEAVHNGDEQRPATGILLHHDSPFLDRDLVDALASVADPSWPRAEVAAAARALVEEEFDTRTQSRRLRAATAVVEEKEPARA